MEFTPWTWRVGLAVSIVTWVGLGAWAGVALWRKHAIYSTPAAR